MFRRPAGIACILLLLATFIVTSPALGAATGVNEFDWENVWDGQSPVVDGMYLPGRLTVYFEEDQVPAKILSRGIDNGLDTDQPALNAVARNLGVQKQERLFPAMDRLARGVSEVPGRDAIWMIQFEDAMPLRDVAEAYASLPNVRRVEPDAIHFTSAAVPNDPSFGAQWYLMNNSPGGGDTRAIIAWNLNTGSDQIIVAMADSGVDWQHPDLGGTGPDFVDGNIWINSSEYGGLPNVDDDGNGKKDDIRGWDFVTGVTGTQSPPQDTSTQDNNPQDYDGHGTNGSGCISAIGNNGIGVSGINWSAKIMALRIGWTTTANQGVVGMSFAAQALDYARINGANVYNASWGSSNVSGLGFATTQAVNAGMIVVTAAGNDNDEVASYLAGRADVIAVAATGQTDNKASFSSFGNWVDISAPGVSIYTTGMNTIALDQADHIYNSTQGTSFSSPIVAGACALAWALNPGFTRQQIIDEVLAAADNIDANNPGFIGKLGSGRLNVGKLVPHDGRWAVPDELPGIDYAIVISEAGDTIALQGGTTFTDRLQLQSPGVIIEGGWDASFTSRDLNNPTILDPGGGNGAVVRCLAGSDGTVLDGFIVRGGQAPFVSFAPTDGFYGGGIYVRDSSPIFRNVTVEDNTAGSDTNAGAGGGAFIYGGSPQFEDCVFRNNAAPGGGAVYLYGGSPTFLRTSFTSNDPYLGSGSGGAVLLRNNLAKRASAASMTFTSCDFDSNTSIGEGGAVHSIGVDLILNDCSFEANIANGNGGGISIDGASLVGSDNTFNANETAATGGVFFGGGIHAYNVSTVNLSGGAFTNNVATLGGGGLNITSGNLDLSDALIHANSAAFLGSGIATSSATVSLIGNTVVDNQGSTGGNNGIAIGGTGTADLQRNLIAYNGSNSGATTADGVNLAGSATVTFSCNLMWMNAAGNYTGLTDPTGTNGNVELDPRFCDFGLADFTLSSSSPGLAAGSQGCGQIGAFGQGCTDSGTGTGDGPLLPIVLNLSQNEPNPFNPATSIRFTLPSEGMVQMTIYDLRGRALVSLVSEEMPAGEHLFRWDGKDAQGHQVASGTYLYELVHPSGRQVRRMALLK